MIKNDSCRIVCLISDFESNILRSAYNGDNNNMSRVFGIEKIASKLLEMTFDKLGVADFLKMFLDAKKS